MATHPETQALLNELSDPSIVAPAQVKNAIGTFIGGGAKVQTQTALLRRLVQAAEIAETDPEVDALLGEMYQRLGALAREAANAEKALREIPGILKQIADCDARLRTVTGPLGYTVA